MREKYSCKSEFVWNVHIKVVLKVISFSILNMHEYMYMYMYMYAYIYIYIYIYMLCKKNGTVRKLFFYTDIFVKKQLFYKNIFCKKTVLH